MNSFTRLSILRNEICRYLIFLTYTYIFSRSLHCFKLLLEAGPEIVKHENSSYQVNIQSLLWSLVCGLASCSICIWFIASLSSSRVSTSMYSADLSLQQSIKHMFGLEMENLQDIYATELPYYIIWHAHIVFTFESNECIIAGDWKDEPAICARLFPWPVSLYCNE